MQSTLEDFAAKGKWTIMKKWILRGVFGCVGSIMFLFCLTACSVGADYEDRWINAYRSKGPRVFDDFQVTRSNQELPPAKVPETPDEILFRIIDTEMKRSGQLIFTNVSNSEIHAFAAKFKEFFPELRITVAHKPFSEWNRVWGKVFKINGKCEFRTVYLDENCCPDEYKKMKMEDYKKHPQAFFITTVKRVYFALLYLSEIVLFNYIQRRISNYRDGHFFTLIKCVNIFRKSFS